MYHSLKRAELEEKKSLISHRWEIRVSSSMKPFLNSATPQGLHAEFVWFCQKCYALVEQNSEPSPTRKISIPVRDPSGLITPRSTLLTCAEYTVFRIMES